MCVCIKYVKMANAVEGYLKAHFLSRFTGGRYSFPKIALLYPWYVCYNAECQKKELSSTIC